jgi:uncharacterized membrane protein YkoI
VPDARFPDATMTHERNSTMRSWKTITICALLVGALTAASALSTLAEDDDVIADHKAKMTKKVIDTLKAVKVSLATACTTAETATKGKAIAAKLEFDDDEIAYEVIVAVVTGEKLVFREVDIDAMTGKVTDNEVVTAHHDDDQDDDDGDDDDDDHDDDDDDDHDDD